jgi:hypothetical protein
MAVNPGRIFHWDVISGHWLKCYTRKVSVSARMNLQGTSDLKLSQTHWMTHLSHWHWLPCIRTIITIIHFKSHLIIPSWKRNIKIIKMRTPTKKDHKERRWGWRTSSEWAETFIGKTTRLAFILKKNNGNNELWSKMTTAIGQAQLDKQIGQAQLDKLNWTSSIGQAQFWLSNPNTPFHFHSCIQYS